MYRLHTSQHGHAFQLVHVVNEKQSSWVDTLTNQTTHMLMRRTITNQHGGQRTGIMLKTLSTTMLEKPRPNTHYQHCQSTWRREEESTATAQGTLDIGVPCKHTHTYAYKACNQIYQIPLHVACVCVSSNHFAAPLLIDAPLLLIYP